MNTTEGHQEKRSGVKKCGQQILSTAGGRWKQQPSMELDGDKWFCSLCSTETDKGITE